MKILFILALTTSLLIGCASGGIADYRTTGINDAIVSRPMASNYYRGVLVEQSPVPASELNARAVEICSGLGGLKVQPSFSHSAPIGWKFYQYQCNGPYAAPHQWSSPSPVSNAAPVQTPTPGNSVESSKSKCAELGFMLGTESFGKCVLQLSR
jgi:hypothetical protein